MVLHRSAPGFATRPLRVVGFAVAYAVVLVTGTAVFIAALGSHEGSSVTSASAQQFSAPEQVARSTAASGVQAPDAFLLASRSIPNDKRGF